MSERDERLRKLEPKLGDRTTRALWLAAQDGKLKKHVDPFISALSDSILAESYKHEKILLPPPAAEVVAGPIDAGEVWYDSPQGRLGLHRRELVKHVGVVGASGSGKTTFAFGLTKSLLENDVPVVVFDVKRTWRSLLEYVPESQARVFTLSRPDVSPFHFNFLIPPAEVPAELYDQIACRVGDEVLYGGLGSQSIVRAATERLRRQYPMPESAANHFTMVELAREVQRVAGEMRMQKRAGDWSATATRIVGELASPPLGTVLSVRRNVFDADLDKAKLVIFEMDLFTQPQYTYFITSFLLREYFKRLDTDTPDELHRMIIFEEAARIFNQPYPQPQFETILREVREKGMGIMWLNQAACDVNATAWANTNSLFVFRQISTKDINAVGSAVAFERPKEKQYVARLGVGECIVRLPDRYRLPFLVKTENIAKARVTDERIRTIAMARLKELGAPVLDTDSEPLPHVLGDKKPVLQVAQVSETPSPPGEPGGRFASKLEEYQAAMAHLLSEITKTPVRPVTYVYSQLGLSKAKGHKIKRMLLDAGLAEETRVPSSNGV